MKKLTISLLATLALATSNLMANNIDEQTKEAISSVVPNTKIYNVSESPIKGFYTVFTGDEIMYVNPAERLLFFTRIYNANGYDITSAELNRLTQKYEPTILEDVKKSVNLDVVQEAVVAPQTEKTKTKYTVVMFTQPHCPACKQAEPLCRDLKINKRYAILGDPAEAERYMSNQNPYLAYENKDTSANATETGRAKLQKTHELAQKLRIRATPTFAVFDTKTKELKALIKGANIPELKKYADEGK